MRVQLLKPAETTPPGLARPLAGVVQAEGLREALTSVATYASGSEV
ncbi:hypothetical protein [Streptomyces murinus]